MDRGILIVISGPSGAGKGTICKALLEKRDDLFLSVSATTVSSLSSYRSPAVSFHTLPEIPMPPVHQWSFHNLWMHSQIDRYTSLP